MEECWDAAVDLVTSNHLVAGVGGGVLMVVTAGVVVVVTGAVVASGGVLNMAAAGAWWGWCSTCWLLFVRSSCWRLF